MRFIFFLIALLVVTSTPSYAAYDSADAPKAGKLEIIRITPDGEDVTAGKQLVIQFNRAVVPIGRMERSFAEIPVIITPAIPCEWRWINTSALACNLPDSAPLKEATKYTLEIKPGLKAEDGETIAETYHHTFTTERPRVYDKGFYLWKSPQTPVVRLVFNQPVDKASVRKHVFFAIGDQKQRVAIKVNPDTEDQTPPVFLPVPGENYGLITNAEPRKSDDALKKTSTYEARRIWLIEPKEELPLDTHIIVNSEAGLVSALGSEAGIAEEEIVAFDTFPAFTFLGIKCLNNKGEAVFVPAGQKAADKCNPQQSVNLSFSSPVERSAIGKGLVFNPPVGGWVQTSEEEAEGEEGISYQFRIAHSKEKTYDVWVPAGLKAAQEYSLQSRSETMNVFSRAWNGLKSWFTDVEPIELVDIFGRELEKPVSTAFLTDHRNPNFVLDYRDAVLEKNVDSEVPFYVNNLKSYSFNYQRLTTDKSESALTFRKDVPQVKDVQFAVPFGVRDILQGKSGALFGLVQTDPEVGNVWSRRLFTQVTPYEVHFKLGHFNSLAWVTDMATGKPVEGAKVSLLVNAFTTLSSEGKEAASGVTDALGMATLPGTETLDPTLAFNRSYRDEDNYYFVRVEKDQDMALLPLSYSYMIDTYRISGTEWIYASNQERYGHMRAWGTTAQGVYRAGDTIQYKIYVRNQDNTSFIEAPTRTYRLNIIDPTSKVVNEVKDITLSAFGGISGEFTIPKEAAVGWYNFELKANFEDNSDEGYTQSWYPMQVLVSDFTPASFRVTNQLNGDLFRAGEKVAVTTHAALHSGGAYTDANARITAILESKPFSSKNTIAHDFQFDSYQDETASQQLFQKNDTVNDKGELALEFDTGNPNVVYGKLMVESAVADDRGKFITGQSYADYVGVDRLVGLHNTEWVYTVGKEASLNYLVVDEKGNPVKGTPVEIAIEYQSTKSARVKGAGNAYLTEYHTEWESSGSCKGTSEEAPLTCTFTPQKSGSYRAVATINDTKGNPHSTTLGAYAIGSGYVAWNDQDDISLTIVPENTSYNVGDTARYLVKNPYPKAKALITIERYGVLDQFVQDFDSSTPVVEFKIKPEYIPGFYLSVTIMSPRVEKPLGEGQVDLGKPTFRMGYVTVPVNDPYKEMTVTAKTDKEVYKPRDKVTLTLHAEPSVSDKKEPVELAVAVLDESVFDLISGGKNYFDPYKGFYKLENLDLRNYSLLTRLVGRQKFEKKVANPGGDGGADLSMRSLFKFVSYWNAGLQTDENGNATVSFEAPDNLTGWRVLAIATTPTDRFGLGDANFKVNRPTELRPVMPNQVMEGDSFSAGFSVMNRTDKPREIEVNIHAEGNIDTSKTPADITKKVKLEPYKRTTIEMPIQTTAVDQTRETTEGQLHFTATAGDASDQDGVEHTVPVKKRRSLEVAANYGTTTKDKVEESLEFPQGILEDVGNVSVVASPTVIGNVSGAFSYMRDYPYICWEQRLSKGVMAAHYKNLKAYMPDSFTWDGSDTLTHEMLEQAASFQAPNGGMAYFVASDQYADPYLSAYTAIAFNWLRKDGYAIPEQVENKLHTYLNNLLKNDAVPDFYSEGMKSTVRAVALAALAQNGKVDTNDLARYLPHVKNMSLFGKSYFLQAALAVDGGDQYAPEVAKMILAASNQTGGKFVFSETWDDSYARILASPLRENCAVLDAFTLYGERPGGDKLVGDVPFKLVRTISQDRKNRDHWENTQENMFCMNALIDFARVYEKEKTDMEVTASMDNEPFGKAAFKDVRDPAATLERPIKKGDAGRKTSIDIERNGTGRLYYATRLTYALPLEMTKPANAGIEIHREYSVERGGAWQLLESPADIKRGELVRVDLYLSVPAARNFVVVDDPVPGGLEPVNRDLATSSVVDANKGEYKAADGAFWFKYSDWQAFGVSRWSFYHQEMRHDSVRYYSDYLPAGNYHLSYTAQAIAPGTFSAMPTIAQEMYDPDVYGKTDGLSLKVSGQEAKP